jgi:opacity protein-like surface antigen
MTHLNHTSIERSVLICILVVGVSVCTVTQARAQGFISPLIGLDFGGDAKCPNLTGCEDKKLNASVSFGAMGTLVGFEEEVGYAPNFFGKSAGLSSSVLTLMSNIMIAPKIGPVQPYVEGGIGLVKTHVDLTTTGTSILPATIFTTSNNGLGWDVGGGVIGFVSGHLGLRGDVRYFRAFNNLTVLGITLSNSTINYTRASVGLVLKF